MLAESYLALNVRHGPFSSTRMRQSVNYAIDRSSLARQPPPSSFGQPTDQYLPPGMPGFRDASIYPLDGPDVAKARRLAGVTVATRSCARATCRPASRTPGRPREPQRDRHQRRDQAVPYNTLYRRLARPAEPWDIADIGWIAAYADPSDILNVIFTPLHGPRVAQFEKSFNLGRFDDPTLQRRLRATAELRGARRYRTYGRLDADLTRNAAPLAAYATEVDNYFFSARMGCQVVQPVYGIDLAALCVRP
jgi:peptide/nickel transport system substrate-binding protein